MNVEKNDVRYMSLLLKLVWLSHVHAYSKGTDDTSFLSPVHKSLGSQHSLLFFQFKSSEHLIQLHLGAQPYYSEYMVVKLAAYHF